MYTNISLFGFKGTLGQPKYLQYITEEFTSQGFTYSLLDLADGSVVANVTNDNSHQYQNFGFLTTSPIDQDGTVLLFGSSNGHNQINSFTPNNNSYNALYTTTGSTYSTSITPQPVYWDATNKIVYGAGYSDLQHKPYGLAVAIGVYGFGRNQPSQPIIIAVPSKSAFYMYPVGAYDSTNNVYYVYFNAGNNQMIAQYSFSSGQVITKQLPNQQQTFIGVSQLYTYKGQIYLCQSVYSQSNTIWSIDFANASTKQIYQNVDKSKYQFNNNVLPFVFDQETGFILALNQLDHALLVDYINLVGYQVTHSSLNNDPIKTFTIAVYSE
ncbi:hypothetical protein DFA_02178 [Cavenderia fasciculata]|uniref:Uncharacterized protein n=1 Tax=Cavenderia fasciculata TaxID=261658 RepID=F4PYC4_CACFS|nr:uncharacterized protein DFA_02178 [Cavenderia fasciculata]EGG19391.1 hypothetical protein DFA_02178 [Cavenderia fasciculata]|eukprot:XP_004357662.1 hypothetical protein DFA_02178 [Cavenderia fasciculata]